MLGALIATSVPSLMVPLYLGHTKMLRVLWEAVAVSQKKCSQVTLCQRIQRQANISGQSSQLPISVLLRCTFHTVPGRRWTQSCIHRKLQHVAHWAIMLPRRSLLALFRWESVFNWDPLKKPPHVNKKRYSSGTSFINSFIMFHPSHSSQRDFQRPGPSRLNCAHPSSVTWMRARDADLFAAKTKDLCTWSLASVLHWNHVLPGVNAIMTNSGQLQLRTKRLDPNGTYVIMHCISITCISFRLGYEGHQRRGLTMEPFQLDSGDTSRTPGTPGRFFPGILQRHVDLWTGPHHFRTAGCTILKEANPALIERSSPNPKRCFSTMLLAWANTTWKKALTPLRRRVGNSKRQKVKVQIGATRKAKVQHGCGHKHGSTRWGIQVEPQFWQKPWTFFSWLRHLRPRKMGLQIGDLRFQLPNSFQHIRLRTDCGGIFRNRRWDRSCCSCGRHRSFSERSHQTKLHHEWQMIWTQTSHQRCSFHLHRRWQNTWSCSAKPSKHPTGQRMLNHTSANWGGTKWSAWTPALFDQKNRSFRSPT